MVSAHSPKAQLHSMHEEALAVVVVDGEGRWGGWFSLLTRSNYTCQPGIALLRCPATSGCVQYNKYWNSLNIQALCLLNDVTWFH